MSDPMPPHDPRAVWQAQARPDNAPTLEEIHMQAEAFQKKIRRRNLIEYVAGALVIAFNVPGVWLSPSWLMRAGNLAIIVATFVVMWQLHRRGSARQTPPDASAAELLEFHRGELMRQREAVGSVWLWYLAPWIPGIVLIGLGRWFQFHVPGRSLAQDHLNIAVGGSIVVLIFLGVLLLNLLAKARLQKQIAELGALREA